MESPQTCSILVGSQSDIRNVPLHKLFEEIANTKAANDLALIFEENNNDRRYTYSQLDDITNRLARFIYKTCVGNNLRPNSDNDYIIAVSMLPSDYLVIALLSIWKIGAAYLPLDVSFPKHRVEHILQESKPTMVIYDEDNGQFGNAFKYSFANLLSSSIKLPSSPLGTSEMLIHSESSIAIILYTSGSTGVPKGVRLSHLNIINRLQWQFKTFSYSTTETTGVFKTALTFVDSVSEIWGPLLKGLTVLVVPKGIPQNPEILVNILEKHKIERLVLVPSLLRALLMYFQTNISKKYLPHLKTWVCSGETLTKSLVIEFFQYFTSNNYRLCNFYGSTEVMGDVTYHTISNIGELDQFEKIPIGLPLDNTAIYLLDSDLNPVEYGQVGELYVAGSNVAVGYVNGRDPDRFVEYQEATNKTPLRLYRTGDFARIHHDTVLYEGRTDSQIKVRGHRVDIMEVENAINAIDVVDKGSVLCYNLGEPNQALLAFVTTKSPTSEFQLSQILRQSFPYYMIPEFFVLDSIPLLVNGKIDRRLLIKNYEDFSSSNGFASEAQFDYTNVPNDKMEMAKELFETVVDVFKKPIRTKISLETNFYDIGGTSLNTISTITLLNDKGYCISIENFIRAKNFQEVLDKMVTQNSKQDVRKASKIDSFTTTPLVPEYKEHVKEMIVSSFTDRSEWGLYFGKVDCENLVDSLFEGLEKEHCYDLCVVVKSATGKIVGICISFDGNNEPELQLSAKAQTVIKFLEQMETPIREKYIPSEIGKVLHCFALATHPSLTPNENVAVVHLMEQENMQIAKRKGFEQVLTTNTSSLTQQLATDVFFYETLASIQINQYTAPDGTKPFNVAADSWKVLVQRKMLI